MANQLEPEFVKFKGTSNAFRKKLGQYYRDGGDYYLQTKTENDKLFGRPEGHEVEYLELEPTTKLDWRKSNGIYAPQEL